MQLKFHIIHHFFATVYIHFISHSIGTYNFNGDTVCRIHYRTSMMRAMCTFTIYTYYYTYTSHLTFYFQNQHQWKVKQHNGSKKKKNARNVYIYHWGWVFVDKWMLTTVGRKERGRLRWGLSLLLLYHVII